MDANNNITDEQMKLLSTTIDVDNRSYSFEATRTENPFRVLINNVSLPWKSNNLYVFYTIFKEQSIACHFRLNSSGLVENGKCTNKVIQYHSFCYHDPFSKPPLKNIPWKQLKDFVYTYDFLPNNWEEKGKIYYDIRSHKTTTTTTLVSY
jgi:hypothetical protein